MRIPFRPLNMFTAVVLPDTTTIQDQALVKMIHGGIVPQNEAGFVLSKVQNEPLVLSVFGCQSGRIQNDEVAMTRFQSLDTRE